MASGKKEVPVASNDGDSISGYGGGEGIEVDGV